MRPAENLTLCLLVKNNQKEIKERLSQLIPHFKHVIAVDTGSTDETPNLLRSQGVQVLFKAFNDDFSSLRNHYVEAVQTPWILSLDSDEYVHETDLLRLTKFLDIAEPDLWGMSPTIAIYHREESRLDSVFPKNEPRLDPTMKAACLERRLLCFRKNAHIRYRGIIHESVFKPILENKKTVLEVDILVHNYGYPDPNELKNAKKRVWYRRLLEKQATLTPTEPKPLLELGLSYLASGEWQKAQDCFKKATVKKNYYEAYLSLGLTQAHLGLYTEALETLQKATQDPKLKGRAYWEMAQIHKKQKNQEETKTYLKQTLENVPNGTPVLWELIRLCQEQEQWHEGLNWFQELKKRKTQDLGFWYYQGVFQTALNQLQFATQSFLNALDQNPKHIPSLMNAAALLKHQGQPGPCRELLKRILILDPQQPAAVKMMSELG